MKEYHLLVLPSLWEGMPNVVMEAFASGLPVVGTDIEGTNELVEDGVTGLLAKAADSESLSKKLISAFEKYESCIKMAENANKLLHEKYSPEVIHRQYNDFYNVA